MFYYDVLKELYENKVRYLVVGGLSLNLHGVPRATQDIDIIIDLDKDNIYRVIDAIKKLGYAPVMPVDAEYLADSGKRKFWAEEKNLIAFSFRDKLHHYRVIDILLVHPLNFEIAYKRKTTKRFRDFEIDIVSVDDLIIMKEFSGRSQDLSDIALLNKLKVFLGRDDGE